MGENKDATPPQGRNTRLVKGADDRKYPFEDRGADGDSMTRKKNQEIEMSPFSEALARQVELARNVQRLKGNRFGIGQVNVERPKTGGKRPDEKDGIPH